LCDPCATRATMGESVNVATGTYRTLLKSISMSGTSDMRQLAGSGLLRVLLMPVTALTTLAGSALVISHAGPSAYAAIMLVAGFAQLLGFADLGLGAGVTNGVVGRDLMGPESFHRLLVSTARVLLCSCAVLIGLVLVLDGTGAWTGALGLEPHILQRTALAVSLALAIYSLSIPLAVGQRMLLGAGRNTTNVLLGTLASFVPVAIIALFSLTEAPVWLYPAAFTAGSLAVALAASFAAVRLLGLPWRELLGRIPRVRSYSGVKVRATAAPAFVIMIGLPLGLQTDRLILSHLAPDRLASYSLAYQVFAPMYSVVSTAGMSLWPSFARRRAAGLPLLAPWRKALRLFCAAGAALGLAYVGLAAFVVPIVSSGRIQVVPELLLAFGALMLIQAAHLPTGMLLTSQEGLRFQATCVTCMFILNLPLSIAFTLLFGAAGPVIASACAVLATQLIPGIVHTRRLLRPVLALPAVARGAG
jgi:hypothetical protein